MERTRTRATVAPRAPQHTAPAASPRRAQHKSGHVTVRGRTRQRNSGPQANPFEFPTSVIPEGSSYEWKRFSNVGQENPFYLAQCREQGWEPVDPKRHPELVPPGYSEPHIIKDGLILMERPVELTEEARDEAKTLARQQMAEAKQRAGQTGEGEAVRSQPVVQEEMMRPILVEE